MDRVWQLFASVDPSWSRRTDIYDKVALAHLLDAAGVCVPNMLEGATTSPEEALTRLGAPMVVKGRTGTGGSEVRVVDDARAANTAIEDLGGVESQIFYQQHLPGELLGYGAVFRDDEPVQELTATERKSLSDPLGPTAQAEATTNTRCARRAARVTDALRVRGFFSAEFLRTPDGQVACIDVCTARVGQLPVLDRRWARSQRGLPVRPRLPPAPRRR